MFDSNTNETTPIKKHYILTVAFAFVHAHRNFKLLKLRIFGNVKTPLRVAVLLIFLDHPTYFAIIRRTQLMSLTDVPFAGLMIVGDPV